VYAFDADGDAGANAAPLWTVSFLSSGVTPSPLPMSAARTFATPEIGITSTPVIDANTGTCNVVAMTKKRCVLQFACMPGRGHRAEKLAGPTTIQGSCGQRHCQFVGLSELSPLLQLQRSGLLLNDRMGRLCDLGSYHGWVMATMPPHCGNGDLQ